MAKRTGSPGEREAALGGDRGSLHGQEGSVAPGRRPCSPPRTDRQGLQGAGNVNAKITRSKVCWKFTKLKGFGTPLVAHIHECRAGKSGPVYTRLAGRSRP